MDDLNIKFALSFDYKDFTWDLLVTRNMSLWHDALAGQGYFAHNKDFGIDARLRTLCLVQNGKHTNLFVEHTDYEDYAEKVLNLFVNPKTSSGVRQTFLKLSEDLLKSISICKEDLNTENFHNFQEAYKVFSAGLNITAVFGRISFEELKAQLSKLGYSASEIDQIIPVITYPKEHTPLIESRIDLLKIAEQTTGSEDKVDQLLQEWLNKYQHVPVNFNEEPWNFKDAKNQLSEVIDGASERLKEIYAKSEQNIALAKSKLDEIGNTEISNLATAISEATFINEFRKNAISKASLEYRPIFMKIAEKAGSNDWRDCFYLFPEEMEKIVSGEQLHLKEIVSKRAFFAFSILNEAAYIQFNEAETKFLFNQLETKQDNNETGEVQNSLKGFPASRGKVQGLAKIILSTADFAKLLVGDILVTKATSVDFVPIMQKAGAFVTDEGGITSHASIVAREMSKPCIIGTKIATKIFKDGDLIEVDAINGVVRKIG